MAMIRASGRGVAVIIDRNRNIAVLRPGSPVLAVHNNRQVTNVTDSSRAVAIAAPGPQGPRGEPGNTSLTYTAGEALGGHRIVRSTGNGSCGYADHTNPAHGDDTLGMTLGAATLGAPVEVQSANRVSHNGWTWAPGLPVFLGANGLPTQTPPTTGFSQVIGHAEDATTLFLSLQPPIYFED